MGPYLCYSDPPILRLFLITTTATTITTTTRAATATAAVAAAAAAAYHDYYILILLPLPLPIRPPPLEFYCCFISVPSTFVDSSSTSVTSSSSSTSVLLLLHFSLKLFAERVRPLTVLRFGQIRIVVFPGAHFKSQPRC